MHINFQHSLSLEAFKFDHVHLAGLFRLVLFALSFATILFFSMDTTFHHSLESFTVVTILKLVISISTAAKSATVASFHFVVRFLESCHCAAC